jgi:hypothetical protein
LQEGWRADDYLILFSEAEVPSTSNRYEISKFLPGYQIIGLCGWDDFILRDSLGKTYCVPTIPLDRKYVESYPSPDPSQPLEFDERYCGKIKWYIKPIVFGGKAEIGNNLTWVSHEQHGELVRWWNNLYLSVRPRTAED